MAATQGLTPRRLRAISIWAIVFLFLIPGCHPPSNLFPGVPSGFCIKGTYYFQPKAAINSFWSWIDFAQAESDFRQLKEDGFNTIILLVPWGLFQSNIHPITYNESAFQELHRLLTLADSFGLKVILRIGSHEYLPQGAGGVRWVAATLLTKDEEWAAYRDLFQEVAMRTRAHSNLLAAFWTFEDAGYTPDGWLHNYPSNAAAFRKWLRSKPLAYWNEFWGENNAGYDAIQAPDRSGNSKKLFSFVQFSDDLVVKRMPDACAAIQQGNPRLVFSFQPRAEINWGYDYSREFQLPRCYGFVTTWFSPYQAYLFGNTQERLNGRQVAAYVPDYVERTRQLSQGLPVFVDQFNFRHFGGPQGESALGGESEELDFVSSALPSLLRVSLGYALWNYQDYYLNIIYNGSFRFGLADWEIPAEQAGADVIGQDQQHSQVEIQAGSWIRQQVSVYPDQQYTLEFNAEGSGQKLEVEIDFPDTQQSLSNSFQVLKEKQSFQWKLKTPRQDSKLTITFRPSRSSRPIQIGDILLYPWIDTGGIYTVDGHPRRELRDLFRRINLSVR